jgi:N-acylglucosamine 2-epimerase
MIAFAMGLAVTKEPRYLSRFVQVADYTFSHFVDKKHGEWYGYLNRTGAVSQTFKGGPYKGCFHVPRALWLCIDYLEKAAAALP